MDYDRKSTVSSFYGGRKNSLDALNSDFPAAPSGGRARDDASSFFNPESGARGSVDLLSTGHGSAGYNRGSFFHVGREEPLKGGRDEEEASNVGNQIWDVYADFNNAGPRYSAAFAPNDSKGYQPLPPSTPSAKGEDATGPVEMVTVPALGPEWAKSEMRDMTKAAKREKKAESRKAKWTAWHRGERGMCGRYCTRKVFVFTMFGVCCVIGILLGIMIPRVPSFSFNGTTPLVAATGNWNSSIPTYFNRAPANFSFPAYASLQVDTTANYLPLTFNHLRASVYDLQTNRIVANGELSHKTLPANSYPDILLPLNFSYVASNDSDQTWANWYNACQNSAQVVGGTRPPVAFLLALEMLISGLVGTRYTATQVSGASCPVELPLGSA